MISSAWQSEIRQLRDHLRPHFPDIAPLPDPETDPWTHDPGTRPQSVLLARQNLYPDLFDYQRDLAQQIVNLSTPDQQILLSLPTGAGKTRTTACATLDGVARGLYKRVAWLAPSIELLDQAQDTFVTLWKDHGGVPDLLLSREPPAQTQHPLVWLATPQAVYSQAKRRRTSPHLSEWDLVVFDEAHQLGARTFTAAISRLRSASQPGNKGLPPLLGLSATPGRLDPQETEDLVALFGGNLLRTKHLEPNPIRVLQRRGVLARLQFRALTRKAPPSEDEVSRLRITARACEELAARNHRILVFTASVPGAIVLVEALASRGVSALSVHGRLPDKKRSAAIEAFARGDVRILTNQKLLATGYDCPAVSDLIIAGKIGSPILFEQVVGRAARGPRTGGATEATIWDFDDHLSLHGFPQSYYRFRDFDWQ